MKCILHIGTEKTGTTAIQNFLNLNRETLLKQGFIYTKSAGFDNNRALPVTAYDLSRRDDFTIEKNINTAQSLRKFQEKTIKNLIKEITILKNTTGVTTLIFSSEHIQSRLTEPTEVHRLKAILNKLGATDITVIVYLRRPAEIANSLYSTLIKFGGYASSPYPPENLLWNNICNHKKTLERFSSVFGVKNIKPRIYNYDEFTNRSIINDFIETIKIHDIEKYKTPIDSNRGLSLIGIELLRRINRTTPKWTKKKEENIVRQGIVLYFEKHFSDGEKYFMENDLYKRYDLAFQESNEWVRRKYFPERETLFAKRTFNTNNFSNISDKDLNRMSMLISDIWNDKQNELIKLNTKPLFSDILRKYLTTIYK